MELTAVARQPTYEYNQNGSDLISQTIRSGFMSRIILVLQGSSTSGRMLLVESLLTGSLLTTDLDKFRKMLLFLLKLSRNRADFDFSPVSFASGTREGF